MILPAAHAVDESAMLAELGMDSLDELIGQVVAPSIRHDKPLAGKDSMSGRQVLNRLYEQSTRNQLYKSFIGQGYHITETPSVIERNILSNPAWYTAYKHASYQSICSS